MVQKKFIVMLFILLLAGAMACPAATFDLRWDKLSDAFHLLPDSDKGTLEQAIQFIRQGEHSAALLRLTELNKNHPENSSLRILSAYAMLQVGNLLGAFQEAEKAEQAANGNSYRCWFLSKVAFMSGQEAVCKRELKHARNAGDLPDEVKSLEAEMKTKNARK